ncbi:MAG: hypothetical protein J5554_03480 [Paludibacteraceae bacterium]|nr:hypothetical protein [Paludibacteraceae bacterium]
MKFLLTFLLGLGIYTNSIAQDIVAKKRYEQAYKEMANMLDGESKLSIKRAVYLAENAYLDGKLKYEQDFCEPIRKVSNYLNRMIELNHWEKYKTAKQIALCNFFFYPCNGNNQKIFDYDYSNEFPEDDWHYQLVSRTMKTHLGQCRSLPWTFKLFAEEMGADVYLAYAPRHCFLMYKDEDDLFPEDWVNVALTVQQYQPTFAIKDFFCIKDSAIIAGTYLTPLSDTQTIAMQLCDLAHAYHDKYKKYDDFTLKCVEKSLKHMEKNPNALLIKGKSLMAVLQRHLKQNGYKRDAYTDKIDAMSKKCWEALEATHWTQETPELRKKWKQSYHTVNEIKKNTQYIQK